MNEPYISKAFNMDDIRRLRNYNSERHIQMTHKEILADIKKDSDKMLNLMIRRKTAQNNS